MRGRKPTPTHLRLLKGNPSRRPLPKNEPRPVGDLLEAPAYLTQRQRLGWTVAIASAPPGLLKRLDGAVLAGFVIAAETVAECNEKIAETALVVWGGPPEARFLMGNPFEKIRRQNLALMVRFASELGFTPASRSRIELMPDRVPADEWDEVL